MARERLGDLRARLEAEASFAATMGKKLHPKKRGRPSLSPKGWEAALASVDERMPSADWEGATPAEWVALYARLYEKVYGVICLDLTDSKTRATAARMAKSLRDTFVPIPEATGAVKPYFDDALFASYVRWAWIREKGREEWRRENGGGKGGKLSWRNLFGVVVFGDFRLEMERKRGRK